MFSLVHFLFDFKHLFCPKNSSKFLSHATLLFLYSFSIMGVGIGAAAAAPIFLPTIKIGIYRKMKMDKKKKDEKFVFLCNGFAKFQVSSSLTAIIACRG